MYKVIATLKNAGNSSNLFWLVKTYKNKTRAQEYVARQQFNPKYNFRIEKVIKGTLDGKNSNKENVDMFN